MDDPFLAHTGFDEGEVRELLALVNRTGVTELEVRVGDAHVSLRRKPSVSVDATTPGLTGQDDASSEIAVGGPVAVTSPLVGIFRASVQTGDQVEAGQSLGRIEALGMRTGVDAPHAGAVEEMLVGDGDPVEYGEALLLLRRTDVGSGL